MRDTLLIGCLALLLSACGGEDRDGAQASWRQCRIEGLENASGLAVHEGELLAVAGAGDRNVYAISRAGLVDGGVAHARGLVVDVLEDVHLLGAETMALQGYKMEHLWALPVDFQGVTAQSPNFAYIGDRNRRIVYWGRLYRDAAGRLARLHLTGLFVAPGATRSAADVGDWRDKGPGLSGLVAVEGRRRTEDLYVVDRGEAGGRILRVRKVDRYGSILGSIRYEHGFEGRPEIGAVSWSRGQFVLQRGRGAGTLFAFREPSGPESVRIAREGPGPAGEGGGAWTGLCHAPDGTVFLVSSGSPAYVSWRGP